MREFFSLARLVHYTWHRRKGRRYNRRGYTMSGFSSFARHALAAISAVFITGLLMVNSLAVQAHEVQSVAGILA